MCCSNPHQFPGRFAMGMFAATCGCGCIGSEQTAWHLENYRDYLKAELASVEKQILAIRNTKA
jgi:hypothetical protein